MQALIDERKAMIDRIPQTIDFKIYKFFSEKPFQLPHLTLPEILD